MAAVEHPARLLPVFSRRGEPRGWIGDGDEGHAAVDVLVEAEHGACSMECAKAGEEGGVADEAAPAQADEGGDEEVRGLRWEAEEDVEEDVVRQQIHRRRAGAPREALRHFCLTFALHLGIALHFADRKPIYTGAFGSVSRFFSFSLIIIFFCVLISFAFAAVTRLMYEKTYTYT